MRSQESNFEAQNGRCRWGHVFFVCLVIFGCRLSSAWGDPVTTTACHARTFSSPTDWHAPPNHSPQNGLSSSPSVPTTASHARAFSALTACHEHTHTHPPPALIVKLSHCTDCRALPLCPLPSVTLDSHVRTFSHGHPGIPETEIIIVRRTWQRVRCKLGVGGTKPKASTFNDMLLYHLRAVLQHPGHTVLKINPWILHNELN